MITPSLICFFSRSCTHLYSGNACAQGNWQNLVPARMIWTFNRSDPLRNADRIRAPVLLIAGRQDALIPEWQVQEAGKRIGGHATTITLEGTHVSLYRNELLVPSMLTFLDSLLKK